MRLFYRLLLGFLAANVLTVAVVVVFGSMWWILAYPSADARSHAQHAVALYEAGDLRGLQQWQRSLRRDSGVYGVLLDEEGGRLLHGRGGAPPRPLRERVREADDEGWLSRAMGERVRVTHVHGADGTAYRWLVFVPPPTGADARLLTAIVQVLIGALLVTAVALWLARSINRPIQALRRVSGEVTRGNLDCEVPPGLLRRGDELGELARSYRLMTQRLAGLLQAQRQLLRDVSHELRSPLARLQLAAELARGDPQDVHFDRIGRETARLDALIGQILALQRMEAADVEARRQRTSVAEVMQALCSDVAFEAEANGVKLQQPDWQPLPRQADAELLRAAFENVLRNAVRHAPPGSAVTLAQEITEAEECIVIADQGPGVPESMLDDIFKPFVRVSGAREHDGGHGVGLAIARGAIVRHGGRVAARNRDGGGLEVRIGLPRTD